MILKLINRENKTNYLPLSLHIHQRLEDIVYKSSISTSAVPIAYLNSQDLNANNICIVNKSDVLSENTFNKTFETNDFEIVNTSSYTTMYPEIMITDMYFTDGHGNQIPLFYCHNFPTGITSLKIEEITHRSNKEIKYGFVLSEDKTKLYFNFNNKFNTLNNTYTLYFLTYMTEDGETVKTIINPVSAVREATWEDLDPETGILNENNAYFTKEQGTLEFTYYFTINKTYFIKVLKESLIAPVSFVNILPEDGWFPRFTNGSFSHVDSTNTTHHYYIPEYENISFSPSKPYFFDTQSNIKLINKKCIYLGRNRLAINNTNRPLKIIISDQDGNDLYAFTTKTSLNQTIYNGTILWSTQEINSYDNFNGIIDLNIEIKDEWEINVNYYYEVKEYLYTEVNLNPIYNDLMYNYYYVFYIKPDQETRALHHLLIRTDGIIVDTSDDDYKLFDNEGNYNPNTFINMLYKDSVTDYIPNDWTSKYSIETTNIYQWLVLAEMYFSEKIHPSTIELLDVRTEGNKLNPLFLEDSLYRNPLLFHSSYATTDYGFEYPANSAIIVRLSYSILEDYGGNFTLEDVKERLNKYIAYGKYILLEWDETIDNIEISNINNGEITLSWFTIGTGYNYKIYRSNNKTSGFQLIDTINSDYKNISYIDSVTSGVIYYYYIVPSKDSIDYPQSYTIGIKSK